MARKNPQALTVVPSLRLVPAPTRLLAAWLDGRSERTRLAYSQDLDAFRAFIGAATVDAAAAHLLGRGHGAANETALGYRAHLRGRALSANTINRHLASLRSLVQLARTLGMVPWTLEISNLKAQPYRDTRGPGRGAFHTMVEALTDRVDAKAVRDLALLRLLYDLGLRRAEAR